MPRAGGLQALSAWAWAILIRATRFDAIHEALLADVLDLRTILLNLHFAHAVGDAITAGRMQRGSEGQSAGGG